MRRTNLKRVLVVCAMLLPLLIGTHSARADGPPAIESFTGPASAEVGSPVTLEATTDATTFATGHSIVIVDVDSGYDVTQCSSVSSCSAQVYPWDWSQNANPPDRHFEAQVRNDTTGTVASSRSLIIEAERVVWDVDLTATPNPAEVGSAVNLVATVDRPVNYWMGYAITIIDDATGQTLATCDWGTTCERVIYPWSWSENDDPPTRTYRAEVRRTGPVDVAGSDTVQLEPQRVEWNVEFTAEPDPGIVGSQVNLVATVDRPLNYYMGYAISIIDDATGQTLAMCDWGTTCERLVYPWTWSENLNPETRTYRAEVRRTSPNDTAGSATLELLGMTQYFDVALKFDDEPVIGGQNPLWDAQVEVSPSLQFTPYTVRIRSINGTIQESCSGGPTCNALVPAGTYYAAVEAPEGEILGRSGSWSVNTDDGASSDVVDGLDLNILAAHFATGQDICQWLYHFRPGTPTDPPSTLSLEIQTCEQGVALGLNGKDLLKFIKAVVPTSTFLFFLNEQTLDDATYTPPVPTTVPTPDPSSTPIPYPPTWNEQNATEDELLDEFIANHTEAFPASDQNSRPMAKLQLRNCRRTPGITLRNCLDLPIVSAGNIDLPETAEHEREAIREGLVVPLFHYASAGNRFPDRRWYDDPQYSANNPCVTKPPDTACDEFPYYTTLEGGPGANLKPVIGTESLPQGRLLSAFYRKCRLEQNGAPFLALPLPSSVPLPSQKICLTRGGA